MERVSLSSASDIKLPTEFKKATGAIHIAPKSRITFVQRKAFNILLANAINTNNQLDDAVYSISVSYLLKELNSGTNNTAHIKAALRDLNVLQVQWESIDKNGKEKWGVATMVSEAEIVDGRIFYSFASKTKQMLLDPDFYTRISLEIQKQFQGQYAYALYENCLRFVGVGKTSLLTVAEWRDLLNALGDYYAVFKNFSRKVLKAAIAEVNEVSDITVTPMYVYEGKSVTHIQFKVERKPSALSSIDGESKPVNVDPLLIKKLTELGLAENAVTEMVTTYDEPFLWSSLARLDETIAAGRTKITSKPAFFRTMVKNNWQRDSARKAAGKAKKPLAPADPAPSATSKPVDRKALENAFNAHRRERARSLYDELHPDEQETYKLKFANSKLPVQTLNSYQKSGLKTKLVSAAFDEFLQHELLKAAEDKDLLEFALANGFLQK